MCPHPATMSQLWNTFFGECLQQTCWTNVFWLHLHLYYFEKELIYPLFRTQYHKATDEELDALDQDTDDIVSFQSLCSLHES